MPEQAPKVDSEETSLRTKLDDLAVVIKKLSSAFLNLEAENHIILLEYQMCHKLSGFSGILQSLESLDGKQGDLFVSFIKDFNDVIQEVGTMKGWRLQRNAEEAFANIVSLIRSLEEKIKDLIPIIISIDEIRKERKYEPFGGLIQKLIDSIEEKRHLIMGSLGANLALIK